MQQKQAFIDVEDFVMSFGRGPEQYLLRIGFVFAVAAKAITFDMIILSESIKLKINVPKLHTKNNF